MSTSFDGASSRQIAASRESEHLFSVAETRNIETLGYQALPTQALMQRAGEVIAKFALAVAPHAQQIWIACGPGNNGGDGLEAARFLKKCGKDPIVTLLPNKARRPDDASNALQKLLWEGIEIHAEAPIHFDICIDAIFGIGIKAPLSGEALFWIAKMNAVPVPVISVDIPSGLDADSGQGYGEFVAADFTLSLLTLKPGLFTGDGRQACGQVWLNTLGVDSSPHFCAQLNDSPSLSFRDHNTHKGTYGDVGIVGGRKGMTGAAILAAKSALHGGAGRVFVGLLSDTPLGFDETQPDLMFRKLTEFHFETMTVVAGCGGGVEISSHLENVLTRSRRLVLDADALNAVAADKNLQDLLKNRAPDSTVLTPHPLEAARLLQTDVKAVQSSRLPKAQQLAELFNCTVVLKGSGSVISAPNLPPRINTTGNARLAIAGTGDVLAGMIGAKISAGLNPTEASYAAVYQHGRIADLWENSSTLTANDLAQRIPGCP
jgi:hydroxyethylthiazole kinase-like uncharacterized protein yjeF